MWRAIKWTLIGVPALLLFLFVEYTLPTHDVVRIVGTEVKRIDVGNAWFWTAQDTGTGSLVSSDVRFINAIRPNGKTIVYRNEDTLWGWPPYFKFDGADLSTEAVSLISTESAPVWVSIRNYGWRSAWLSIYPNALSMKVVAGPDVTIIPWFNIVFLTVAGVGLLSLYRLLVMWRRRRIDPVVTAVGDAVEDGYEAVADTAGDVSEAASGFGARLRGWLRRPLPSRG